MFNFLKRFLGYSTQTEPTAPYKIETPDRITVNIPVPQGPVVVETSPKAVKVDKPKVAKVPKAAAPKAKEVSPVKVAKPRAPKAL